MFWDSFEVFLGYPISNINLRQFNKKSIQRLFEYKSISQNAIGSSKYFKEFKDTKKIINEKIIPKNMFLQKNDILIKVTMPHQAILIEKIDERILVPSSFIIVRPINDKPNFNKIELWSIINSEIFKKENEKMAELSYGRTTLLSLKNIKNIKIDEKEVLKIKQLSNLIYTNEKLKQKFEELIKLNDMRIKYYERKKI